jgi:hypothetical protein
MSLLVTDVPQRQGARHMHQDTPHNTELDYVLLAFHPHSYSHQHSVACS